MAVKKEKVKIVEPMFTKEQVLNSEKYSNRRDALGVILENDKFYSITEMDELLDKFMKGKVE